jgi:hypothetical protein
MVICVAREELETGRRISENLWSGCLTNSLPSSPEEPHWHKKGGADLQCRGVSFFEWKKQHENVIWLLLPRISCSADAKSANKALWYFHQPTQTKTLHRQFGVLRSIEALNIERIHATNTRQGQMKLKGGYGLVVGECLQNTAVIINSQDTKIAHPSVYS